jgi:ATP-dependent protease ClpP protease subunit
MANKGGSMTYKNLSKSNSDDDEDLNAKVIPNSLSYFEQVQCRHRIQVYLDEAIREPAYYRSVIQRINNLSEEDILELYINTPGGRVDSAISIINAIGNTSAEVVGIIDNEASSAGSLIALSCPNLVVAPYSTIMIHNWFGGGSGKGGDLVTQVNYSNDMLRKLMTEVYQGFLTELELKELFIGRDYYFHSDEIEERLILRNKFFEKLNKKTKNASAVKQV